MGIMPDDFEEYITQLRAKVEEGAKEHGDKSYDLQASKVVVELQKECLDIAGWGYFLWRRLEKVRKLLLLES